MEGESSRSVLLANDDLFFGGRMISVLEKTGFRVITAGNADEAAKRSESDKPDLAIVNLNSQRLGGIELIRRLRAADSDLRILAFMSHSLIPPVKDEIFAAGATKLATNGAVSTRLPTIVESLLSGSMTAPVEND